MSRVLDDVNDCPLHNTVHDITMFSKYYDPIYHPQCYPDIFESPMAVKQWIESALNSHVLDCPGCLFKLECLNSSVRYSVQW